MEKISPAVAQAAASRGFDPAVCAAIVEVESGAYGAVAKDGRPTIKHEGHFAWRLTSGPVRQMLADAGLAWPKYDKARDKDRPSQRARWQWFGMVEDIAGRDVAIQSCSWGLAQVMGANWSMCGYTSPAAFEAAQATEAGQIETFLRYLEGAHLTEAIHTRDWTKIAEKYNGPKHYVHNYAGRMEAAYRRITGHASPMVLRMGDTGPAVRELQRALGERLDGAFGPRTRALVEAFQRDNGLTVDGVVGPATWGLLNASGANLARPPAQAVPTPKADIAATAGKVAAGAGAVTAAVKGLSEATEATAGLVAGIDPLWLMAALALGAALFGAAMIARRRGRAT